MCVCGGGCATPDKMRDHLLLLQLDKMGGNFQRRQKERETDGLSVAAVRQIFTLSVPVQRSRTRFNSCVKLTQNKYLLLAIHPNRMAAFLTCGNGRITLLKKTVVHPEPAAAPAAVLFFLSLA